MSISEFNLIEKYFHQNRAKRKDVSIGIGDDCALVNVPKGQRLAVTVDTLVENTHFLPSVTAKDLAWKAVAVNLSDLAAMGAEPAWLTLALTLPTTDEAWLESFSEGFFEAVDYYGLQLIGGDTTSGPLSITIQAMGFSPEGATLCRSGATAGDVICVTGTLGDAGLGLDICCDRHQVKDKTNHHKLTERLHRPRARVAEGLALRNLATAAIDLSDGLAGDITHILKASAVGAEIDLQALPLSDALLAECSIDKCIEYALTAGDDYELCFTLAEQDIEQLQQRFKSTNSSFKIIGRINSTGELSFSSKNTSGESNPKQQQYTGYQHFTQKSEVS